MSKNILLGITGSVAASKSEILFKNLSIDKLSNIRDNFLIDLIELKKKYRL